METDPDRWLAALRGSHERLKILVEPLTGEQVEGRSYAGEWSIAQVLSHLGSGAEIFRMILDAALRGEDPPGREAFAPVWEEWNAKAPVAQVADALTSTERLLDRLEAVDGPTRARFHLSLFGMELDFVGFIRMRLGEHAVHTWDVAVVFDAAATVDRDAVALLVDVVGITAARSGKPTTRTGPVRVVTTDPARSFELRLDEQVALTPAPDGPNDTSVRMPAEALVRLVYGRLDGEHTPEVDTRGVDVDELRAAFPGF